ncbi:SDR family oxidoreductase [Komagataeibacter xylinus]|uniref:SDR family oxidoreductase n=1 Tax=Komagataeibacter xylinus TaxID=28448 RepID=UPI00280B2194|nr:SDR family oxidoreductase [Komagataeibacter xylinus]
MKVNGAVVFVTGANRGLGLAFARQALALGAAKVYAGTRNTAGFGEPGLIPIEIDVTDPGSIARAAEQAKDVTILVNNAGIAATVPDALDDAVEELSRRMFEVNYYGVIRVTKAFAPILARSSESAIINVLSSATWLPVPLLTPYSASKAAAWSYANHVRLALKPQNTSVLSLHVHFVDTDLTKGLNIPKSDPNDVARRTFEALEAGKSEIMADETTRLLKASLSAERPGYIDPDM